MTLRSFVGALLSLAALGHAAADNLVSNPGFESGTAGWDLFVPADSKDKVQPLAVVGDNPHSGSACAVGSADGFARYGICTPKTGIPVAPGDRYRIQAWVRFGSDSATKDGWPQAYVRATLMKGPDQGSTDPLGHIHVGLNGETSRNATLWKLSPREQSKEWRKIEGVIEIPPDTALIIPVLFVQGVNGKVYWDDVSMEKVPSDTPLTPDVAAR